jgi:hypothetical protein
MLGSNPGTVVTLALVARTTKPDLIMIEQCGNKKRTRIQILSDPKSELLAPDPKSKLLAPGSTYKKADRQNSDLAPDLNPTIGLCYRNLKLYKMADGKL